MTDRLLELLRERSYARRRVVLASGRESDFFVDVKQTALLAEGHALLGEALLAKIRELAPGARAVAGVALGGCPLASAVALTSFRGGPALDALYVRKEVKDHGSARLIEGDDGLEEGATVVVVEDVVTTGGSTRRAIGTLVEHGYTVPAVVAVVDRLEGGADTIREAGHAFVALYDREDFGA